MPTRPGSRFFLEGFWDLVAVWAGSGWREVVRARVMRIVQAGALHHGWVSLLSCVREGMGVFPKLKTGVVAQYPALREGQFSTAVFRFLDSSEQRFRDGRGSRRRWVIQFSQLDEGEMQQLATFFVEQQGRLGAFDFEDPWTGETVAGCRFEDDELQALAAGEFDGRTEVTIVGPPV
jgi:Conserved hypothetical protein 2217 (DUF2460)